MSSKLTVGLVIASIVVLAACQVALLCLTPRPRTRLAGDVPAEPIKVVSSGVPFDSSALQLTACADLSDIVPLVKPAVVNIDVASPDVRPGGNRRPGGASFDMPSPRALERNDETLGSGIVVDPRGYVLTCLHLIEDHPRVWVTVFSSERKAYPADVIATDASNDLAMLKIEPDTLIPAARLGNSDMAKITDTVLAIGSPFGLEHTVTGGIISDSKRTIVVEGRTYSDFFQTDAAVNRGSAGGALASADGEVIGVVTAIASTSEHFSGISFAIPINKARPLLFRAVED